MPRAWACWTYRTAAGRTKCWKSWRSTVASREGPALGAALLAGVGAGLYESVPAACEAVIRTNAPQEPDAQAAARYAPFYALYQGLYPALHDSYTALAKL